MKNWILAVFAVVFIAQGQDTWKLNNPSAWARDKGTASLKQDGNILILSHTGRQDWSLSGFPRITVKSGEYFELSCRVKLSSSQQGGYAEVGVVLRDEQGEVIKWSYGSVVLPTSSDEWAWLKTRFLVPPASHSVEPRLIGFGSGVVQIGEFNVERRTRGRSELNPERIRVAEIKRNNIVLVYSEEVGAVEIANLNPGAVSGEQQLWKMPISSQGWVITDAVKGADTLTLTFVEPETVRDVKAIFRLEGSGEMVVTVDSPGALSKPLDFPPPIKTDKGQRLIVPMNEGMGYPVDEDHYGLRRLAAYSGHGICMGFFGATDDATGEGWICILETPDDAAMSAYRGSDGLWLAGPSWDAQRGTFGYKRKVRYVFFERNGYVAICKRYRQYAKEIGLFAPFREKVKQRPNIDLLIGAANIWNWDAGTKKAEFVAELQGAGMERILWSGGGSAEELKALNALPKVLTGRYDIYQDIMDPAQFPHIRHKHGDWVTEAFPHDINWAGPSAEQWRHGWGIELKDGKPGMIDCAVICDAKALPYARKRIAAELELRPYTARFLDTTVASPWFECYHPDHPMTRSDSRRHKMELLKLVCNFGLVCGSETGHEASVPCCDYFEGMMSLGPYRVPDSGRHIQRIWDDVPEALAKYQVGEAYRLPLWELVYHDCVVAYWYWGDYNNKLPKVWRKRDLFNALYGTPPMYMFTVEQWREQRERFVDSYKVAAPVARETGYYEMTDHHILTEDRSVQRSFFANGVVVTVNFGESEWISEDGSEIPAMEMRVLW